MKSILTLGETMAAFSPGVPGPLRYIPDYHIRTAGAESNVAVGIAKLGIQAIWYSRLGRDEFGYYIRNQLRSEGVDCSYLIFDSDHPTGLMFKERSSQETRVYYYRKDSAASHMKPEDLPAQLFIPSRLLHLTGITPVLSSDCRDTVDHAFYLAEKAGMQISFDPNIRRKLWKETDYTPYIRSLTLKSHIVLLGLDEGEALFQTREAARIIDTIFCQGRAGYIAIKNGAEGAIVADRRKTITLPPHPCCPIDPIGAGDGFNAGFLAGLLEHTLPDHMLSEHTLPEHTNQQDLLEIAGQMGCICGALATQTTGDVEGYPDREQMEAILKHSPLIYR